MSGSPGLITGVRRRGVRRLAMLLGAVALAMAVAAVLVVMRGRATRPPVALPAVPLPLVRQPGSSRPLGINISAPLDWEGAQLYADVIRQSRDVTQAAGSGPVPVDADGWPQATDFKVGLWGDAPAMHGTYALSFSGQAAGVVANGATVSGLAYARNQNRSTARVVVTEPGSSTMQLVFSGARRAPGGAPGLTHIKLMRPVSPGASESYPPTALFHRPLVTLVRKFQVVRFMDYLATNSNQQVAWSDRPRPGWMSFDRYVDQAGYGWQGIGGCLEHVVLFANQAGRDAWINIPARANADYVLKVAQLFRYGSDGTEPYLSPQKSPVYPPLDPGLKVYVEYSNEVWNFGGVFTQTAWNRSQSEAEVAAGHSPLNYDDDVDRPWGARRVAKRIAEISLTFRHVFGDAAMMTRVRPVYATWLYGSDQTIAQGLKWLHGYAGNGDGDFVPSADWLHPVTGERLPPRPVGYYLYGAGGSAYYSPASPESESDPAGLDLNTLWTAGDMNEITWRDRALLKDAFRTAAFGLRRIAYEGGPDLPGGDAVMKRKAVMAWRGTDGLPDNMTDSVLRHHDVWSQLGGDLLVYFTAVHGHEWGFASVAKVRGGDVSDLASPKLVAVDELGATPSAAAAIGAPLPGAVPGAAAAFSSAPYAPPDPLASGSRGYDASRPGRRWAGYVYRAGEMAHRTATLRIAPGSGTVGAYWDGALVGTRAVEPTVSFDLGRVEPGLHGLIVRAVTGSFSLVGSSVE
jgi:hypothetical protein